MHEMALCESIRRTLEEQSRAHKFSKVKRVCLEVGPFSGVEVEALRFGFDVVMRGTLADGAKLDNEELLRTHAHNNTPGAPNRKARRVGAGLRACPLYNALTQSLLLPALHPTQNSPFGKPSTRDLELETPSYSIFAGAAELMLSNGEML